MTTLEQSKTFSVPILFIVFNRPEVTARVFEMIRKIKPEKLFIAADGPRDTINNEYENTLLVRKIVENIDWPCLINKRYSEKNLGCKIAVSSAITWFFDNVEEGIILEDDCLPNLSFFYFCRDLLERYKNTDRVKVISGTNFLSTHDKAKYDYYFSNFPQIWGWATWKRAWAEYDLQMRDYPRFKRDNKMRIIFKDKKIQKYYLKSYERLYQNLSLIHI